MTETNYGLHARSGAFDNMLRNTRYTDTKGNAQPLEQGLDDTVQLLTQSREEGAAIYLVGNGGSAAVASHTITDFVNVCRLRAFTLHDSALITCMSNDFGYDQAFKRIIHTVFNPGDVLIAISSSGKSANICNAASMARSLGNQVITLSGFHHDNPLRKLGDINFWLDSCDYGLVEIGHLFLLHNLADRINAALKNEAKTDAGIPTLLTQTA